MPMPVPTKEFVESRGGVYHGWYHWPVPRAMQDEFFAFKAPPNQLRHDYRIQDRVVVYSLPNLTATKEAA